MKTHLYLNIFVILLIIGILYGCEQQHEELGIQLYRFNELDQTGIIVHITEPDTSYYLFRSYHLDNLEIDCEYMVAPEDTNYILDGSYYCLYKDGDTLSSGQYQNGNPIGKTFHYGKNGTINRIEFFYADKLGWLQNFNSHGNLEAYCMSIDDTCFYYVKYDSLGRRSNFSGPPFIISNPRQIKSNKILGYIFLAQEPTAQRHLDGFILPEMKLQDSLMFCKLEQVDSMEYKYEIGASQSGSYNALISMEVQDLKRNKIRRDTISFEVKIK